MPKVRVNSKYIYIPCLFDLVLCSPVGIEQKIMAKGDQVKVINLFGCPKANTMGQCYIENAEGKFCGMVSTNSLVPIKHWNEMTDEQRKEAMK